MDYAGIQKGRITIGDFYRQGTHAFPDLATGAPPGEAPLSLSYFGQEPQTGQKIYGGWRNGNWGAELSLADLGTHRMGFDISGNFGTTIKSLVPQKGRMREIGDFNLIAPAIAGTYTKKFGPFEGTAKIGVALGLSQSNTVSDYWLEQAEGAIESGRVNQRTSHASLAPLVAFSAGLKLGKDLALKLEAERYAGIRISKSADPAYSKEGKVNVDSLWMGLERKF